jgi:hypothetical protein
MNKQPVTPVPKNNAYTGPGIGVILIATVTKQAEKAFSG